MADRKQPLALVFPPHFAVDQPYLALPSLAAFLRKHGVGPVLHLDCNIESLWYFLDSERFRRTIEMVSAAREKMGRNPETWSSADWETYAALTDAELAGTAVSTELEPAKTFFKEASSSFSMEEYHYYLGVLSKALRVASAPFFPSDITLRDFTMRFSPQVTDDIFAACSSAENPYIPYFNDMVIPRLLEYRPTLVGVSLACMSQILPAFTLARLVRRNLPESKIVFGGQVFNRLADRVKETPRLFDLVDFFVMHEGETALLALCRYIEGQIALEDVPNLVYIDNTSGEPRQTGNVHVENVSELPLPDFSDLDLSLYLSPAPVLPYQPVRGCYWHRCAFCNHHVIHPAAARHKSPVDIVRELSQLSADYGARHFTMVSESIDPRLYQAYAEEMISADLDIEWYGGARIEKNFDRVCIEKLKESGCVKLYFGLETGVQRVLNEMCKGIDLATVERVFRDCADLGLAAHLFIMIGYPTETARDLELSKKETVRLASLLPKDGFTYYISTFQLKPHTAIFQSPGIYGVASIQRVAENMDMEYLYAFERSDGEATFDYEADTRTLEAALDQMHGPYEYPENIVHYVTMRGRLIDSRSRLGIEHSDNGLFEARQNLGMVRAFYCLSAVSAEGTTWATTHLVYDLSSDAVFEISDPVAWELLRKLKGTFSIKDLLIEVESILDDHDSRSVEELELVIRDLLDSAIIVPVPSKGV